MTRRTITSENRVGSSGSKFPKIKFNTKGECKRVLLIDQAGPWQEYIHYIKVPVLIDGVKPKMTTRTKPRSDEEVEDYATDLLSMALCFGDAATIEETGYDEASCPACAVVREAPEEARLAPVLRFAANVVDYVLKPGTWNVQRPFSASVKIWNFTSSTYDDLVSLQEQHGELIRAKDLSLECTNAVFNQAKLGVLPVPGWQELGAGSQLAELLAEPGNVATDEQLRDSCGRDVKRKFMEEDTDIALRKWRKAVAWHQGGSQLAEQLAGAAFGGGPQTLDAGVSALLGDPSVQAVNAELAAHRDQLVSAAEQAGYQVSGDGLGEFTREGTSNPSGGAAPARESASLLPAGAGPRTAPPSDPFAALGGTAAVSGTQTPASAGPSSPGVAAGAADPFAVLGGAATASGATTTPTAAPAAGSPSPMEPGPAETAPASEGRMSSFDELVKGLGG